MFLIRRRSDGKWWRNLGYHSRYGKELWADKPDGIKPFKTIGGAKNAMGCFCYDKIKIFNPDCSACTSFLSHPVPGHFKYVKNKAKFDQQFEIVPVRIEVIR